MAVKVEDLKQVKRGQPYNEFRKEINDDPVKVMKQAADLEMSLSQYGNLVCSEVMAKEKRSITSKLRQDEGLFTRNSVVSKASLVEEFFQSPVRIALLQDLCYNSFYGTRSAITLESSQSPGDALLPFSNQDPAPNNTGLSLNPGELVATSCEIGTDNYRPFKWDYDQNDDSKNLKRHNVSPGAVIPPTTLGQREGAIQMEKWGNRFVLPYEMLTGNSMRVNKLAAMIRLEGFTEESRMFGELVGILEKGDGTDGSAAPKKKLSVFGGTDGTFSLSAFLTWLDEGLDFPFQITHVLMNKAERRKLIAQVLSTNGLDALNQLTSIGLSPMLSNMNEWQSMVRYGRTPNDELTTGMILGIDARAAAEYVMRSGMAIRQQAENITNESREVVISDTYLYSKVAHEASTILDTTS